MSVTPMGVLTPVVVQVPQKATARSVAAIRASVTRTTRKTIAKTVCAKMVERPIATTKTVVAAMVTARSPKEAQRFTAPTPTTRQVQNVSPRNALVRPITRKTPVMDRVRATTTAR